MRPVALVAALLLHLCGPCSGLLVAADKPLLAGVRAVAAARLDKPALFWRNAKQAPARDVLVIEGEVADLVPFTPRGITPPLFMLGEWVCQTVRSPLAGKGRVLLVAPRDAERVLWLTPPGAAPENLAQPRTAGYRKLAERSGNRLAVPEPGDTGQARGYKDLEDLIRQERLRKQ